MPKKHWSNGSGWEMAKVMHAQINQNMMEIIKNENYSAITCDEVTLLTLDLYMIFSCYNLCLELLNCK
jgi:hypothetical protein